MPRKTPVRELQEESTEGSLRRSSRIAQGSPAPTKVAQRRNSTSDDTPAKTTKGRRLSLSQENNSDSTENKSSSQTNAADTPKKLRLTRSCSKSPILLAKDLESKGAAARTRTRRGSKTLDEEDTSSESSLQQVRIRSTRSESKSPTTVNNVEPARTRARRGSITERVVPLEKIEEAHPSTPEPKKRVKSRRSSLTEMSQLDVIKETEVNKNEIKKTDLETISETKENDDKGIPDTPESNGKTASPGQEKDKFSLSPVVVIQKSKVIADLTTSQNSEEESITEVKERNDTTEAMNVDIKTDNVIEEKETKNIDNQNSNFKKESKCVTEENEKVEETSVTPSAVEFLTNLPKSDAEENTKVEPSLSSDNAIKKRDNSPSKEDVVIVITEIDTEMQEELPSSNNEKTLHPDFKKEDRSGAEEDTELKEKETIISGNIEPSASSGSSEEKNQSVDLKRVNKCDTEKDKKIENEVPIISIILEPSTSSDSSEKKIQPSDFKKADKIDIKLDEKVEKEVPIVPSILEPSSDSSENKTQTSDFKKDDKSDIEMDKKIEKAVLIVSDILKPSTSSDISEKKTQISDFKKDDKCNTEVNKKVEEELPIVSDNLDPSTSDSSNKKTQNSESEKGDNFITEQDAKTEEEIPSISNNQESSINFEETSTHTSDIKEKISSLETVPINKMETDKTKKLSSNEERQCVLKKLAPEDEAILKNIDSVLNTDISEPNKLETSSKSILSVSGEIDLEKIEADVLTYKSPNEINQSTPENNQNTEKISTKISDKESPTPAKNLDEELCSNSNILTPPEDLCNKSLSSLLPNQVEMTSGSDGSFNIKLSLQHVESFGSQENISDCKRSKEYSLNESQDDLNMSDSSNKECVKKDMPGSKAVPEVNTSSANISLDEIEKNSQILDDSFSEPMDVDDPSLLHIDDILTASKKRSSNTDDSPVIIKKVLKSSIEHTSPMDKESASIIDSQKYSEKLKNNTCNTSDSQLETNDTEDGKSEQSSKNITDTINLNLKENKLNKTDESDSKKTDIDQATFKKGDVEQIELNQSESDNNENTQRTIQDISDSNHIVIESVAADGEDKKRECVSPTFSINSADITDEDEVSPKKQTIVEFHGEPSDDVKTTLLSNRDANKENENSIAATEAVSVEKQIVENSISEVMINPDIEENLIHDTNASTQERSDKSHDEQQIEASLIEETENPECPETENTFSTPQNKLEEIYKADDNELSKEIKQPSRKSIEKEGTNDKGIDQVTSTTSNETKSDFETDKTPESNVDNASVLENSSNRDVRKDSIHNGGEEFVIESDKNHSSKKDAKSNSLSTKDKDSDEDQLEDMTEKPPSQEKAKLAKSKSKKITKICTNEPVEMDHSAEENIKKDEPLKKKRKKKKVKSTSESSFNEKVENFIEETLKELSSSSEDENNIDEDSNNVFIDDMAEEGEEDTPSEGSNDIPCDGESINSSDTYTEDDDDDSYEADSFIDDDDDKYELLSGEENFLQDEEPTEKAKTKKNSVSPLKQKKKRQRIIRVSVSDDETPNQNEEENKLDVADSNEITTKPNQIESKSLKEEIKEDSSINLYPFQSTKLEMATDTPTDISPSKNDVIHVDSDSSESEVSNSVEQVELNNDANNSMTESRSNRKSSITIQENIKLEDIEDGELSDRISKVVDWFYTGIRNNSDTGNISLNVSLDYADLPPNEESTTTDVEVNFEKDKSCNRQSKKRKSDDFIENESPKKATFTEVSGDEDNKHFDKSPKLKLLEKSKRKSLKEKNQEDDVFSQEFTSAESKLVSVKPRKKRSHKFATVENLNRNELEPGSKVSSKRLNDDKSNYILPKRAKRGTNKVNKTGTQEDSSTIIKDITSTINKNDESIENDFCEEFIENNIIETDIMRNKNKKIKKNKKVEQVADDIGNVITKRKKTKKVKEVIFSNEDTSNLDNDFHHVSSRKADKHIPFTRKMSKLNEFNVKVENEKNKKMKRLSYSTKNKKTEIPCSSGILKQQFTSNATASRSEIVEKQERTRRPKQKVSQKLLPSKNIDLDGSWESEIFETSVHPSKSNKKHIDAGPSKKKKTEIDSFSSKDFKNRMLYDSTRIKRMATKILLRQRKGF